MAASALCSSAEPSRRDVDGLKFNFASEGEVDGKKHKTTITAIEVDAAIDPGKFSVAAANTVAMAP
jgi:hypothetical protein